MHLQYYSKLIVSQDTEAAVQKQFVQRCVMAKRCVFFVSGKCEPEVIPNQDTWLTFSASS